jgi:hypothetical protein
VKPIFASGSDVPEATKHDIEALGSYPGWVHLTYEPREGKPGEGWQTGRCGVLASNMHCDEYPFFATEQGGPSAQPLPDLRAIERTQNLSQGDMYSGFVQSGVLHLGSPFLGVPVPPAAEVPTWYACKSAAP